ncbi:dihydrofolate reductase [Pseudostreptobacillus hongkongensis]|uniref:dihydrofolate reductase n=1 Tax=Pseudostreptobacillus hongkongensis TaxID=1162717 RepID=UPI0028D8BBEE|nr:dihydrofolate reductase [Pseudostreptobacillus hongkongensis]
MLSIIVAVGKNLEIGKDNKMLWYIPEELEHFKNITKGHTVIMGRKTFDSIGKILPDRKNIVLSRKGLDKKGLDIEVFNNFDEIEKYKEEKEEYFIIGGSQIYKEALKRNIVSKMYVSHIDYINKDATEYFPKIDDSWIKLNKQVYNGWIFCEYIRRNDYDEFNGWE